MFSASYDDKRIGGYGGKSASNSFSCLTSPWSPVGRFHCPPASLPSGETYLNGLITGLVLEKQAESSKKIINDNPRPGRAPFRNPPPRAISSCFASRDHQIRCNPAWELSHPGRPLRRPGSSLRGVSTQPPGNSAGGRICLLRWIDTATYPAAPLKLSWPGLGAYGLNSGLKGVLIRPSRI